MNDSRLTSREALALERTSHLWNEIVGLPVLHPDDINDVRHHIHAIQNIILARPEQRIINKVGDDDFPFDLDDPITRR